VFFVLLSPLADRVPTRTYLRVCTIVGSVISGLSRPTRDGRGIYIYYFCFPPSRRAAAFSRVLREERDVPKKKKSELSSGERDGQHTPNRVRVREGEIDVTAPPTEPVY